MDEGLPRRDEVVRRVLAGGGNLCNSAAYGAPSLPGSDENQNRLQGEEVERAHEAGKLQGGPELFQQDSMNNNEEMDNRPCPPNMDTGVPGSRPSVCPSTASSNRLGDKAEGSPLSTPSPESPSSPVALLQELEEVGDHPRLPQQLHQIAEAYFLEEDYELALQFIQLERLYHERLLSNLTALQESWETRWSFGRQGAEQPQGRGCADLRPTQLETLIRICRTHKRPSLSVEKHAAAVTALRSGSQPGGETADGASLPCAARHGTESGRLMEEHQAAEELRPAQGGEGQSGDASAPHHQGAQLCNFDSSPPLEDTPTSPAPGSVDSGGDGGARKESAGEEQLTDGASLGSGSGEGRGPQAGTEQAGAGPVATGTGDEKGDGAHPEQDLSAGVGLPHTERPEVREGEEEEEEEEFPEDDFDAEEDEFGEESLAATGMGVASLDELAKRIMVEQTAPTPGLVSILKRKSSLEGSPPEPPAPPKQAPKRKVRFSEPEDTADPDDVGLDSCLLLLLLCMVTMVISVGGTALYCTLADAQSSVCADFSRNVDFYLGQVQRGVDEVRHWLSPGS